MGPHCGVSQPVEDTEDVTVRVWLVWTRGVEEGKA